MKLNTQRKVAVAILGVALGALVLDKTVLSPGGASAATPGTGRAAPAESPKPSAEDLPRRPGIAASENAPAAPEDESAAVASRLSIALDSPKWTSEQVVGSLRASPQWAVGQAAPEAPAEDRGAVFKGRHALKAVMSGQSKRVALIDGRPMNVGEVLEGYTLIEVGARSAVFESGSSRVVLSLEGHPEKTGRTDR